MYNKFDDFEAAEGCFAQALKYAPPAVALCADAGTAAAICEEAAAAVSLLFMERAKCAWKLNQHVRPHSAAFWLLSWCPSMVDGSLRSVFLHSLGAAQAHPCFSWLRPSQPVLPAVLQPLAEHMLARARDLANTEELGSDNCFLLHMRLMGLKLQRAQELLGAGLPGNTAEGDKSASQQRAAEAVALLDSAMQQVCSAAACLPRHAGGGLGGSLLATCKVQDAHASEHRKTSVSSCAGNQTVQTVVTRWSDVQACVAAWE